MYSRAQKEEILQYLPAVRDMATVDRDVLKSCNEWEQIRLSLGSFLVFPHSNIWATCHTRLHKIPAATATWRDCIRREVRAELRFVHLSVRSKVRMAVAAQVLGAADLMNEADSPANAEGLVPIRKKQSEGSRRHEACTHTHTPPGFFRVSLTHRARGASPHTSGSCRIFTSLTTIVSLVQ